MVERWVFGAILKSVAGVLPLGNVERRARLQWLQIAVYKQLGAHEVAVHRRGDG
jgi:hypothetical protein